MTPHAEVVKQVRFEAAHHLPHVPEAHKCRRLHGHSFVVDLHVRGPVAERSGWVMDFGDVGDAWRPLHDALDHRYLNEVEGLDNPTSERLAVWIWERLRPALPGLCRVVVHETCTSSVIFQGDER